MKKQKKRLALDRFKIAKLTVKHSSIIGGTGRPSAHCGPLPSELLLTEPATGTGTGTGTGPNTDNTSVVDTQNSSIPCADDFRTGTCNTYSAC